MEFQFPETLDVKFPSKCACCLADTGDTRVSYRHTLDLGWGDPRTRTKKLQIPYCRSCRDHVDWSAGGGYLGLLLSIPVNALLWGGLVAILVIAWQFSSNWAYESESVTHWVGVGAVSLIVGLVAWRRWSRAVRPRGQSGRAHARAGESVEIVGFQSRGLVTIRIHNPQWASLFSDLNPKLVSR